MPQSSTMSRTLILLRGFWLSSFMNDALMACFVKFATVILLFFCGARPAPQHIAAGRAVCSPFYLALRYSSMDLAPSLPAPIARMTVAAPVTASPPAYTA